MTQTSRLVLEIDSRDAEQKAADTRRALEALEDAGLSIKPSMDRAGAGLESVGKSATKAKRSIQEERAEIEHLLESINPLAKKLNEVERQELALNKARKAGKIELDTFNEYSAKLSATRAELARFNDSMAKTGISAKQTAAALRGVPAQFTDIAVSLQGGQAPLTVFLQQGGQLKDMFGGAGPAAKALGGYILGLVNPLTITAAAAAALVAVYVDAERQVSAFNKALFSGAASSGQTASSLDAISKGAAAISGSLSEARDAVIQLAGSANLSQTQFVNLAQAAASIGEFSGKSAGDVAKSLGDMGDNATKAAEKISSQYGLLTSAQYDVITALDEQGKKQEALDTLSESLNQNAQKRLKQYRDSLSEVERDWNDIGTAISNAYSNVKSSLFPNINDEIANLEKIVSDRKSGGFLSKIFSDEIGPDSQSTKFIEEQIKLLKARRDQIDLGAKAQGDANKADQERIKIQSKWSTDYVSSLDKEGQAKIKLKALDAERATLLKAEGADRAKINKEYDAQRKKIEEDAKDKKAAPAVDLTGFNSAENALKSLTASYQDQFRLLDASEKAGLINADEYALQKGALLEKEKSQVESAYQAEIAALEAVSAKASTTSAQRVGIDQKIADSRQKMVDTLEKLDTDQEILSQQTSARNAKDAASYKAFSDSLNDSLKLAQQGLDNQLAGIGLGQEGRQRLQDDLKIRQDYQKQIEKLNRDYAAIVNPSAGQTDNYNKETADLKNALAQRLASQQDYYVKLKQYQSDWTNGANSALQDYISETSDIAGQTYTLFSDSLHGVEDAFVDAATTGKLSFKDLADSIIADLARIVAKAYVVTPILAALGIGGDSASGSGGGALSSLTGGGGGTGIMSYLNTAKNVMSAAGSNFGQSVMAGWSGGDGIVGGLQGAFTNGADYVGSAITSAFASGSATATQVAGNFAASTTPATVDLINNSVSVGGQTIGTASGFTSSAAASSLSSLTTALSYVGAVYSVIQSYQAYGAKGAATTAGFATAGAIVGSFVGPIGTALGAAIGSVVGSFASSKLFSSGEKYPDLSTSATGRYVNGQYTDTGIAQSWQRKAPKYGTAADNAMSSTIAKFSTTLGNLYSALGNGAPVVGYSTLQQRKTSGKYSSTFGAQLDDGSVITGKQQFKAADISAALTADYDDIMGTFLAKAIVSSKSLPEYFKSQFTEFANDWNTTADQVIKAIEGVFTRFNGVNDALSLINVNNLKLDNTGLMASDAILNMIGAMADLDTTTATAKEKVDALNTSVGTYYQAFFTADEQFSDLADSLKGAFAGLGLQLPDTRSAYRAMVEDIDVTTSAGQAMFATMMGLASNADSYYTEVDKRAQASADAALQATQAAQGAAVEAAQAAASAWANYYELFATDTQKAGDALERASKEFAALGLGLPASRADFAAMVNAIDQTTTAGKALFNSLLGIATDADAAFDVMEASAATATQAAQDAAKAQAEAAQAISDALNTTVSNSFSAVQRAIGAQQKAAQDAYNATTTSLNDMASTAADKVSGLASVGNDLSSALKSLRGDSDKAVQMLRAQAQATLQAALATARSGGSLADFSGLGDALDTASSNTTDLYASLQDFNRDQGRTAGVIAELEAINGKQLTSAEKLVAQLQSQLDEAEKAYDLQMAQYDSQLAFAQSQIDALNGVDTTVQSVTDAVDRMNADVVRALAGQAAGAGAGNTYNNNAALVESVYQRVLGRSAEAGGVSFWSALLANGSVSYAGLVDAIAQGGKANGETVKIPGYASGGNFGGGIRLVGERGPEIELTGSSKILNARQTAAALKGGSDSSVVDQLRVLGDRLDNIDANTKAGALNSSALVKIINRVTDGGNAMLTKELA